MNYTYDRGTPDPNPLIADLTHEDPIRRWDAMFRLLACRFLPDELERAQEQMTSLQAGKDLGLSEQATLMLRLILIESPADRFDAFKE
jgi:hypothetical protein